MRRLMTVSADGPTNCDTHSRSISVHWKHLENTPHPRCLEAIRTRFAPILLITTIHIPMLCGLWPFIGLNAVLNEFCELTRLVVGTNIRASTRINSTHVHVGLSLTTSYICFHSIRIENIAATTEWRPSSRFIKALKPFVKVHSAAFTFRTSTIICSFGSTVSCFFQSLETHE